MEIFHNPATCTSCKARAQSATYDNGPDSDFAQGRRWNHNADFAESLRTSLATDSDPADLADTIDETLKDTLGDDAAGISVQVLSADTPPVFSALDIATINVALMWVASEYAQGMLDDNPMVAMLAPRLVRSAGERITQARMMFASLMVQSGAEDKADACHTISDLGKRVNAVQVAMENGETRGLYKSPF